MSNSESDSLCLELSKVGVAVSNVYDLVNTRKSYVEAIPVLVTMLERGISDDRLKEGVIRALSVKEAKGIANKVLIREWYRTSPDDQIMRWTIGLPFTVIIEEEDLDDVIKIVKDSRNGTGRRMFVLALAKFRSREIEQLLITLLSDNDVILQAIDALSKMKTTTALTALRKLENHPNRSAARDARKAVKRLERVLEKKS